MRLAASAVSSQKSRDADCRAGAPRGSRASAGRTRLRSAGPPQSDGGGDRAVEGGEADQHALVAVALAGQLADVELAASAHLGGARVADVRVVLPHDDLRPGELAVEVLDERVERAGHVPVAQVPRRHLGPVHLLVVLLGVAHEARVLLGEEVLVLGDPAVAAQVRVGPAAQLDQLGDDLVLARDRVP